MLSYRAPATDREEFARRRGSGRGFVQIFSGITALMVGLAFAGVFGFSLVKILDNLHRPLNWVLWIVAGVSGLLMVWTAYRAWEFLFAPRWRGELPDVPRGPAVAVQAAPPRAMREKTVLRQTGGMRPPTVTYSPPDAARQMQIHRAQRRVGRRRFIHSMGNAIAFTAAVLLLTLLLILLRPGVWVAVMRMFGGQ